MRVVENVLELVGQTPMLRMRRLEQACGGEACAEIWAKLEFLNPGGSVKDRAALGTGAGCGAARCAAAGRHDC